MRIWSLLIVTMSLAIFPSYLFNITYASDLSFFAGRNYNNKSLDFLAQNFWQWWITVPQTIAIDPKTDLHECMISYDSTNQTVMLYNSYLQNYSTSCNISSEKSILVPLLVGECDPSVPEVRSSKSLNDLWKCAADGDEVFKFWNVILDGRVLFKKSANEEVNSNLVTDILVRNSPSFTINIPEQNHYGAPKGSYLAVVDGYYFHLKPLSPGQHTLTYSIVHEDHKTLDVAGKPRALPGHASYILNVN